MRPAPLDLPWANPSLIGILGVFRGHFCIVDRISRYDAEAKRKNLTKKATYNDIRSFIKSEYGVHVSNLSISQTKERCGLTKGEYKGNTGAEGHYVPVLKPEKEKLIIEAFRYFGML